MMVRRHRGVLIGALLAMLTAPHAAAAQHVALEALGEVTLWKTDAGSQLLALNHGDPVVRGQLYTWLAWQPTAQLRLMALGEVEGISGHERDVDADLQLLSIRWWPSRALRIEAGKILPPVGEFSRRRFADVNPLIGRPDTYADAYPIGASVTGAVGAFDYTAALVSLPAVNERYTPHPGTHLRPAAGLGITPGPSLRIGVAATLGPYLNVALAPVIPIHADWTRFDQTVIVGDLRYSVDRFDTRAEVAWSSYQVPTVEAPVRGLGWYVESRATITPRWFVAARAEHNRYAFVLPVSRQAWVGVETTEMNAELGVGYRVARSALIKGSVRRDHWPVHRQGAVNFPDGYAIALQAAVHTDLLALFDRKP